MKNQTICSIREELEGKKNILIDQLVKIKAEEAKLKKMCSHDLIVLISDNHPRRIMLTRTGYCPVCNKKTRLYPSRELKDTDFKYSKTIDLTGINIVDKDSCLKSIQEHILSNYDYYYNQEASDEELQADIIENIDIEKPNSLKRIRRIN